jgi:hypothetical protein
MEGSKAAYLANNQFRKVFGRHSLERNNGKKEGRYGKGKY